MINVFCNIGLFLIVLRQAAEKVDKSKIFMITSLSALSILAWLPSVIFTTVLNSSGYPLFMRFANYAISLDAAFSTLLFMYFYPAFRRFVIWVFTCGKKGELEIIRSQERARVISFTTFVPLRERLSRTLTPKTLAIRSALIPKTTPKIFRVPTVVSIPE
jgi:hypothetical protein